VNRGAVNGRPGQVAIDLEAGPFSMGTGSNITECARGGVVEKQNQSQMDSGDLRGLFVAQSVHGIYAGCPASGQPGGEQDDSKQEKRNGA